MKPLRWNAEKNGRLKAERNISFEQIAIAIEDGGLLDILQHRKPERYPGQRVLVVALGGYAYLVPFLEEPEHFFLKTIIPSRKATRDYMKRG